MDSPFDIRVYSKSFGSIGTVNAPTTLTATPRHNAIGTLDITVPTGSPKASMLMTTGARVVVHYKDEFLISGPVRALSGEGPHVSGQITFTVEDDIRLLWRILGWPAPGNAITAQGSASAYDKRSGAAETVLKGFVTANAARLGLPVTVQPTQGRGSSITVQSRMNTLAERLLPAIDNAGVGVTVRQSGLGLVVDCYSPQTFPRSLTELGGAIRKWSIARNPHTATRAVVGGQGEGTAREFRSRVSTSLESDTGDVMEVFVDGRDTNVASELDQRGDDALAEARMTWGFSVELAETDAFRYGGTNGVHVGDKVSLQVGDQSITDVLREVTFSWTTESGLEVTPVVGGLDAIPGRKVAKVLSRALRSLTSLQTR